MVISAEEQPSKFLIVGLTEQCLCEDIKLGADCPPAVFATEILDRGSELFRERNSNGSINNGIGVVGHSVLEEKLVVASLFDHVAVYIVNIRAHSLKRADILNTRYIG